MHRETKSAQARSSVDPVRVADSDLAFMRQYALDTKQGTSTWAGHMRASGVGIILVALGCGYGMLWRGWSAFDAALLLYADMLLALLADLIKLALAGPAVARAVALQGREEHCWAKLMMMRFRGQLDEEDIRDWRRLKLRNVAKPPDRAALRDEKGRSISAVMGLAIVVNCAAGITLVLSADGGQATATVALSDPAFFLWLLVAALWHLVDAVVAARRSHSNEHAYGLVPAAGTSPAIVLLILPAIGMAAVATRPDQVDTFWLVVIVAYAFASLVVGAFLIISAWQRQRWLVAFLAKDERGELTALSEVLVYRYAGSGRNTRIHRRGVAADQRTRNAYKLFEDRPDWVSGKVRCEASLRRVLLPLLAIMAWLPTLLALGFYWHSASDVVGVALLVLLPIAGLISLGCLYSHWQLRRYGDPVLELEKVPLRLGGSLRARLRTSIRPELVGAGPFKLILTCEAAQSAPGGASSTDASLPAWKHEWTAPVLRGAHGTVSGAEINLDLPLDQPETEYDESGQTARVAWRLTVQLPGLGLGYRRSFELPVFHPDAGIEVLSPGTPEFAARPREGRSTS